MPRLGEAESSPELVHKRRMDFLSARRKHESYQSIADRWGVSASYVYAEVRSMLGKMSKEERESAEETRQLELDRLEMIAARLEPLALREPPSLDHVEMYLKVMHRRARLLGLDAATKHEVSVEDKRRPAISDAELYLKIRAMHERIYASTGIRHPMLNERNPFEALEADNVVEGQVVAVTPANQKLPEGSK
jgi:hypothetical protein